MRIQKGETIPTFSCQFIPSPMALHFYIQQSLSEKFYEFSPRDMFREVWRILKTSLITKRKCGMVESCTRLNSEFERKKTIIPASWK